MSLPNLKRFSLCLCAGFAVFLLSMPAQADDIIKALTEDNVRSFIEETAAVTGSGGNYSKSEIADYLEKHLEGSARFKSVMKYNMPGMPPQETTMTLDKEEFMDSVNKQEEAVSDYETLVEITDIKIASNGKKAFVKTQSTEYATMDMPTESGGSEAVPMEGVSDCVQILSLNKGRIQMYSANCTTSIHFLEY